MIAHEIKARRFDLAGSFFGKWSGQMFVGSLVLAPVPLQIAASVTHVQNPDLPAAAIRSAPSGLPPEGPSEAEAVLISSAQRRPQAADYMPPETPSGDTPGKPRSFSPLPPPCRVVF
jgi:hypothetical protein